MKQFFKKIKPLPTWAILLSNFVLLLLITFFVWQSDVLRTTKKEIKYSEAKEIYDKCAPQQNWHECYKKSFAELTKSTGLEKSFAVLSQIQEVDSNSRNCHVIAHYMAREAYKKNPSDWLKLTDNIDINSCGGGFLHGIMEMYIDDNPDIKVDDKFAVKFCGHYPESFKQQMCYHLMGHLFLVGNGGRVEKALKYCEPLNPMYSYMCFDGLFMEHHQKLALAEHEIEDLPDYKPTYLNQLKNECKKYDGIKGNACWTEIAEIVAKVYGYDPKIIFKHCQEAPKKEQQIQCYSKAAVVLVIYVGFDTPEKLGEICSFYKPNSNEFKGCINTSISSLMHYSANFVDRGNILCSTLGQDSDWCFKNLIGQLKNVAKTSDLPTHCQILPKQYQAQCLK